LSTNTYVALATQTLGTAASSVTFSSIPAGYTDLIIVINGANATSGDENIWFRCNGDTATNYSYTQLYGTGSSAGSTRASGSSMSLGRGGTTVSSSIIQFMNYSNTTTFKTALGRGNNTGGVVIANVGLWRNTAAINEIYIGSNAGNFNAGYTFSIYGIAATSVGAKATGGDIYSDASYYYHVFDANGTFTPTQSISADVLVVAGGGGTATQASGGGGAGGVCYQVARSLTATGYTVTVGAGGTGAGASGTAGGNSVFDTITALGGGYAVQTAAGVAGGSGSGAAYNTGSGGAATQGSSGGATGYGNAGANGTNSGNQGAGGGGGAGAAGSSGTSSVGGNGGVGLSTWSSWGTATGVGDNVSGTYYFAGGGGGAVVGGTVNGIGGLGGGGNGGQYSNSFAATNGKSNTGGGGGGGGNFGNFANGGSGVVIVRYAK
jgi:hypothetical protein